MNSYIAFGLIGENATAHDLAIGLLMAWLPVLILCSIIDRNPVAADDIRKRLNKLVDRVCISLQDDQIRRGFIKTLHQQGVDESERQGLETWINNIARQSERIRGNFFVNFAGQGRIRWHYGAAHAILTDIEACYVAQHGRNWLDNESEARMKLVLGPVASEGLLWFDFREMWQITSAVLIVVGTVFGAFILSYWTPTVGLGCRSGGYLIFVMVSFILLCVEMMIWWVSSPVRAKQMEWISRRTSRIQQTSTFSRLEDASSDFWHTLKRRVSSFRDDGDRFIVRAVVTTASLLPWYHNKGRKIKKLENRLSARLDTYHDFGIKEWSDRLFFKPVEFFNTVWLVYIVIGQTIGSFQNCDCQTSIWASGGGYLGECFFFSLSLS